MAAEQRTLNRWDAPAYRRLRSVAGRRDGRLDIAFCDGTPARVMGARLVGHDAATVDWQTARVSDSGLELIVRDNRGEDVAIPWDIIRSASDNDFAAYQAAAAEEQARRIGFRLRELRRARNLTARQLAESAGIPPQNLYRIEHGKRRVTLGAVGKILAAMGCGYRDLVLDELDEVEEPDYPISTSAERR